MKYKNIPRVIILIYSSIVYSQVGIGTTNPTKELDINGELRIRNVPVTTTSTDLLTVDVDGNVAKLNVFFVSDVNSTIATTNVDFTSSGVNTINNIDLGLSTSVFIPRNTEAFVIISYSVPIGISSFTSPEGYYGIRFLKDGVEAQQGSRKFTFITSTASANMVTVSNTYTENFSSVGFDRTIIYSINGYIEQDTNGSHTYRFNMWQPTGPNFNWGRGSISKIVYVK
jgi:hypothetical protein